MNYWNSRFKVKESDRWLKRQAKPKKPQRKKPMRQISSNGALKKKIVRNLGLLDRAMNGNDCRIKKAANCTKIGSVAYHIVPAKRGDAIRLYGPDIVWACAACNYGESRNRSLYRDYHVEIFGKVFVEKLEAIARETVHYSTTILREMLADVRYAVVAEGGIPE